MKRIFATFLLVIIATGISFAENPADLSRAELISRLSNATGMSNSALELALGKTPQKMEAAMDALTAVNVITQIAEAQDDKALVTSLEWVLSKAKGKLITGPLGGALTAVTLYKATLELARDHLVIPAMNEKLYKEYQKYREEDLATRQGNDSVSVSFDRISARSDLGYHILKEKVYQDYIKALDLNPALIGNFFARFLRSQVDAFWISVLETRFQRDYVKKHRDELVSRTWEEFKAHLETPGKPDKPKAGNVEKPVLKPATPPTKPTGGASLQNAISKFMASEEARAAKNKADDVREGKSDTQYKFEWPVPPHQVGDQVVFASVMYQKRDAKSDWFGIGYAGDAQNPVKISLGEFLSKWGK